MKHRFETEKQPSSLRNILISLGIFLLTAGIFTGGVAVLSQKNDAQEAQTLQQALRRDIIRCYALEGSYPESLDYIREHYGLQYDRERFFVDYHPLGRNLMPDVTIIDRRAAQ